MGVACAGRRHVDIRRKLVDAQHGARDHFRFRRKCLAAHVEEISMLRYVSMIPVIVARCNDIQ